MVGNADSPSGDKTAQDPIYLQTLGRGIEVLTLLADRPLTLPGICEAAGVNRNAAYRVVQTLAMHGLVERDHEGRLYRLTPRLWELGVRAIGPTEIRIAAGRAVRALTEKYGETVHLAVYHRGEAVYIDKADGWHPIGTYTQLGGRAPAYCVATGKTLLAHQTSAEVQRCIDDGLQSFTPFTITDPAELEQELDKVRREGFAFNRGEWRLDVAGVAVPLLDVTGSTVAALGFSGPSERIKERFDELLAALNEATREISGSPA